MLNCVRAMFDFIRRKMKAILVVLLILCIITVAVLLCISYRGNNQKMLLPLTYKAEKKEANYPIDLVYLWVDGNDEVHAKKRRFWKEKLGLSVKNTAATNIQAGRWIDNSELKYSLRSVEKFAPWINKIYIITPGAAPKWLNTKHPKIKIINQDSIMPADATPSFNSNAIEHCLPNLKELSEHFIYANDDMFFVNYVYPEDFFKDGKPIYALANELPLDKEAIDGYERFLINSAHLIYEKFGKRKYHVRYPHHNIDPYIKSSMQKCQKDFAKEMNATIYNKFRTAIDIQRSIYTSYAIITGDAFYKAAVAFPKFDGIYLLREKFDGITFSGIMDMKSVEQFPLVISQEPSLKLFCINDGDLTTDEARKQYRQVMERIFPNKSAFEK